MRLRQIEDFLAVAECGGIRAAARKRGVSQPAITKSMRRLEADLGAQLVQRTPHGILLTPSGRAFFERVRVAHAELRRAEDEAAQGESSGGSVAFGAGPTGAMLVVPESVIAFRKQFPDARIRIVEGFGAQLIPLVRDGTLDFAVGPRQQVSADTTLSFKPLFVHQLVVVARKGHPLRNARSLGDLGGAEWASLNPPAAAQSPIEQAMTAAGLPMPGPAIQCESYHVLVALLTRSNMLGIITGRLLAKSLGGGVLEAIPVAEKLPAYTTHLITRTGIPLSRLAAVMAKMVLQAARRFAKSS
jgi:LysR family transcriptional regulator, regulator of abg operon